MFTVWVTVEVVPEHRQEFLDAIEENARASVRKERDCLRFDVVELQEGSNKFGFYEVYRDEKAFDVDHLQAPHFLAYTRIAQRVVVPGSQKIVRGQIIHSLIHVD